MDLNEYLGPLILNCRECKKEVMTYADIHPDSIKVKEGPEKGSINISGDGVRRCEECGSSKVYIKSYIIEGTVEI